jgi:nucleotide-binding universal stress UspA family protein
MRVLIAYDGTAGSEAMLEHLCRGRAGLPEDTEALVLTVSDAVIPLLDWAPEDEGLLVTPARVRRLRAAARKASAAALRQTRKTARQAAAALRKALPRWRVRAVTVEGSASAQIVHHAGTWSADLIVLGSHGHRPIERWLLGSVVQRVLAEAPCSVRIVRGRVGRRSGPVSLVLGMDGSPGAETAVAAMAKRAWPAGSSARLAIAIDARVASMVEPDVAPALWAEVQQVQTGRLAVAADRAAEALRGAGLSTRILIKPGDPKQVLIREATRWWWAPRA